MVTTDRRQFLRGVLGGSVSSALVACSREVSQQVSATFSGYGRSVMDLVVPKMDHVRFGFIGVGRRGSTLLKLMLRIDGASVTAIADPYALSLEKAADMVRADEGVKPVLYGDGDEAYRDLLARDDVDAVVIATPWSWHVPMALHAMSAGKQCFVEVPAALTIEDCWKLVDASEKFQVNCMMMENVCYGREELMLLNMVRNGLFGDLLHGEAAYIHPLRWQMKDVKSGTGSWRTKWHGRRNANLYPTHGLGPIAQYMDVNRGDRFDHISSISSPALGRGAYADRELEDGNPHKALSFICGDMNTSIIKTIKGRSIMLQHDTTTPRPYTRHNLIQGTNGIFAGFPNRIALENNPLNPHEKEGFHHWDQDMKKWHQRYDHVMWTQLLADPPFVDPLPAESDGGINHIGLDFVMLWRMVYCLRNGIVLDQNVYDAATWSAIVDLSEQSVRMRGDSIDIPDFTRGKWKSAKPLSVAM